MIGRGMKKPGAIMLVISGFTFVPLGLVAVLAGARALRAEQPKPDL